MDPTRVAYLTDVEGNLDYFHNYVAISKVLKWSDETKKDALDFLNEHDHFVFGGDSQDKGIGDVRFVRLLLALKKKYPERVHWIIGNRDCNKLRLAAELSDEAINDEQVQGDKEFPYWVEEGKRVTPNDYLKEINEKEHTKANRLRWMLKHTMGADGAFERRKMELQLIGDPEKVTDDDVVKSYEKEVDPNAPEDDKFMLRYLEEGKLLHSFGKTLFVHGALSDTNFGTVPGPEMAKCSDVSTWVEKLNAWAKSQVEEFKTTPLEGKNHKSRKGHGLMDYGVPKGNDGKTVICASFLKDGNAAPLQPGVVQPLAASGISTVVSGHIPHGDCPTVIRTRLDEGAVTVVMADTSYSKMGHKSDWGVDNRGGAVSEVIINRDGTAFVHGKLADGSEIEYDVPLSEKQATGGTKDSFSVKVGDPLLHDYWVKAKFKGKDEFLICRGKGFTLDYKTIARADLFYKIIQRVAYMTDVEGNLDYFHNYVAISKVLKWSDDNKDALDFLNEHDHFVFGGDSQDKGIGDVRFVRLLLALKKKYPERVHWIIGNRDCNKLRLAAELSEEAINDEQVQGDKEFPYWVEEGKRVTPNDYLKEIEEEKHTKANRLRWMLKHTMGADGAFERRKMELKLIGDPEKVTDDDVVKSYEKEVDPNAPEDDKFMLRYLEEGKLLHSFGKTLFVHGALSDTNFGTVPGEEKCSDVSTWVEKLNAWAKSQVEEFIKDPAEGTNSKDRKGHGLMDYGVPNGNDGKSVIYESFLKDGNAAPLQPVLVTSLAASGISTVVSGHIPHGDCPTVIRTRLDEGGVTVVMADTSDSKMGHKSDWGVDNRGGAVSEVIINRDGTAFVHGKLADGSEIEYDVPVIDKDTPDDVVFVGDRLVDNYWAKAEFRDKVKNEDEFLICKGKGFKLDVKRVLRHDILGLAHFFPFQWDVDVGLLEWETRLDEKPRPYLRVKVGDGKSEGNAEGKESKVHPKVLRFVLEHAWGLTQPKALLTVTGGAQDFDLDAEDKDELLEGLTDTAKSVGAWFTTGGTSAGIMKYMGLARLLYANEIPLIGIASYGIVKGHHAFQPRPEGTKGGYVAKPDTVIPYEKSCKNCTMALSVEMDVNHSHFLFAENKWPKFGQEFWLRSQLESAICDAQPLTTEIYEEWKAEWKKYGVKKPKIDSSPHSIPAVCICVQGGPGTIETVMSSVNLGTPVLLVQGSGKAADLIADVHLVNSGKYKGDPEHEKVLKAALDHLDATDKKQCAGLSEEERTEKLIDAAKEYFKQPQHDKQAEAVFEFYAMPAKNKDKLGPIVGLVKSNPKGFGVYNLEGKRGDLKGALLSCILAWQDHRMKEKDQNLERVREKTVRAVQWDRPEILQKELLKERKVLKHDVKGYMQVINDGLLEALCIGNERCVAMLIEHGADITEFGVDRRHLRGEDASLDEKKRKADKMERTRQALQWKILMESINASTKTQHVVQMLEEVKDQLQEKGCKETILKKTRGGERMTYSELQKYIEKKPNWKDALYSKNLPSYTETELEELFFASIDSLSYMDEIYKSLMGDGWSYTAGALGATWDLFLCMVLMNRHAIAKICWRKLDLPVRAALVACKLYREMAKKPYIRTEVSLEMEENATDFEKMAVDVMQLAMEENMEFAIESLETRVGFLGGNTTYDQAIDCDARDFVTKCCKQATDRRFYGDIDLNPPKWLPDWLPVPSWVVIFFCLCTGGLAAPHLLSYRLPPEADSCRPPGQIRKIPKGYPDKPQENEIIKKLIKPSTPEKDAGGQKQKLTIFQKLAKDAKAIENFSEEQKAEVWKLTFSYSERWWCFIQAPVVHFQSRALIYTSLVLYFTSCVTNVELRWNKDEDRLGLKMLEGQMSLVCLYMVGSCFIEGRQLLMSGVMEYIADSWNFIDITTLFSFFLGHYLGVFYKVFTPVVLTLVPKPTEDSILDWPNPAKDDYFTELLDDRKKMYCVCLFFCWLRLLHLYSVNKTLGTLVRAILTMVPDITTFIFVWGFFLMAFAAAMFAGETTEKPCKDFDMVCKAAWNAEPKDESVKGWKIWWILRTYFQAYGEMDLEKMTDWVSVIIFMILLLVLQLVLNNTVFVAVLTTKFETVLEDAETDWMFEMHDISEEFMQHPWPSPFNIPWLFWEALHFLLDETKVQELITKENKACLSDQSYETRKSRWWHFHTRLRHPRFWEAKTSLLPREVLSELEIEEKELKEKGIQQSDQQGQNDESAPDSPSPLVQFVHSVYDMAQGAAMKVREGFAKAFEGTSDVKESQKAFEGTSDVKESPNELKEVLYRDGDVRRRDRALVMRAKAKYLEKHDEAATQTTNEEMMKALLEKIKTIEQSIKKDTNDGQEALMRSVSSYPPAGGSKLE